MSNDIKELRKINENKIYLFDRERSKEFNILHTNYKKQKKNIVRLKCIFLSLHWKDIHELRLLIYLNKPEKNKSYKNEMILEKKLFKKIKTNA